MQISTKQRMVTHCSVLGDVVAGQHPPGYQLRITLEVLEEEEEGSFLCSQAV